MGLEKLQHLFDISNDFFQPTFTIFENAIVVSHKKVGTRFFSNIASYPIWHWEYNNQYDISLMNYDSDNQSNIDDRLYLNTKFSKYFSHINFGEGHESTCNNYDEFFEKNGVKDINEFIFNNPKDMYIVIRNPIERFLSGITQILGYYLDDILTTDSEFKKLKQHIDITDSEIKNVKEYYHNIFNTFTPIQNSPLDMDATVKIMFYIIEHNSKLYFRDIHTRNYLFGFKEFIYEMKDTSKIKILDLEECRSKSAFKLFSNWRSDVNLMDVYKEKQNHILSNKIIYNKVIDKVLDNTYTLTTVFKYLNSEYNDYTYLKNTSLYMPILK